MPARDARPRRMAACSNQPAAIRETPGASLIDPIQMIVRVTHASKAATGLRPVVANPLRRSCTEGTPSICRLRLPYARRAAPAPCPKTADAHGSVYQSGRRTKRQPVTLLPTRIYHGRSAPQTPARLLNQRPCDPPSQTGRQDGPTTEPVPWPHSTMG